MREVGTRHMLGVGRVFEEWGGGWKVILWQVLFTRVENTGGQLSAALNMRQKMRTEKQGLWDGDVWEKSERKAEVESQVVRRDGDTKISLRLTPALNPQLRKMET